MPDRLEDLVARIPEEWGKEIRFGEGWDEIVTDLDRDLKQIFPSYVIHQMKEKFGILRFYWGSGESDPNPVKIAAADEIVEAAHAKSAVTCEMCGESGSPCKPNGFWLRTLCEKCAQEAKNVRWVP